MYTHIANFKIHVQTLAVAQLNGMYVYKLMHIPAKSLSNFLGVHKLDIVLSNKNSSVLLDYH